MGVLLDGGKYQVLENMISEPGYTAAVCIDVESRNNYKPLIFNIYSEPVYINEFLPLFYGVSPEVCYGFHGVIPGNRCIMAYFDYHKGVPLMDHLKTLPKDDYPARARIAGSFLEATLFFDMLPPVFAVSALTAPYTVFDTKENAVYFNFCIKPRPEPSLEEKRELFTSYLKSIFVKNRYLPDKVADFIMQTGSSDTLKFVPVCAAWRQISAVAMEEYEKYKKESIPGYIKRLLGRKLKRKSKGTFDRGI